MPLPDISKPYKHVTLYISFFVIIKAIIIITETITKRSIDLIDIVFMIYIL